MSGFFRILFLIMLIFAGVGAVEAADGLENGAAVQPETVPGPAEKISTAIRAYVAERLPSKESDIRVRLLRPPDGSFVMEDGLEVKEGSRGLLGRVVFLISSRPNGKPAAHQWVTANVEMIRSIVVSARPLRRAEVIGPDDVEIRSVAVTRAGESYLFDPDALIGKRVIRSIGAGLPISVEMVETAPVIRSGDRVTMIVELGGLRIATMGRAKEEGFLGRQMAVVNPDSQKTVYGEVIDAATVKITLPR
ncbi:flagellar basal body P-ring formation chaperone FlgA [Candidatus Manganitrophus noduliformans]|uniref:Flagella basal body P-ring formation protein FlgA n=1 Tax=Candidatus Manganitrophus noduliformans TaxID=2606439 RepID=A0A7X6ICV5_9BACT|nr:flagellar basal body P-ring formation chaperone FlgA [Candidatus Manganitrophus noduliformans]NKE73088.1 flagellar basal body P-ring formation protein FlgA [Candidatus Manganitrophus noduliformans]